MNRLTLIFTFILGLIWIGSLDYIHTLFGVQAYFAQTWTFQPGNFPWFVPLQFGFASAGGLLFWNAVNSFFLNPLLKSEAGDLEFSQKSLMLFSLLIGVGYLQGVVFLDTPGRMTGYIYLNAAALAFLRLRYTKRHMIAYLLVGLLGPMVECFILRSPFAFFEFRDKDLFGTVPGWEPFVYGWAGAAFHELSKKLGKA